MSALRSPVLLAVLPLLAPVLAGCGSDAPRGRPIVLRPPPPPPRVVAHRPAPRPPAHKAAERAPHSAPASGTTLADTTCSVEIERAKMCTTQTQQMNDTEREALFRRFDDYLANRRDRR